MKNKWLPNFSSIKDGQVTIKHWSTSSTIEIILNDPMNIGPVSLHLDYSDFDSLIECIKSLENDEEYYNQLRIEAFKIQEEAAKNFGGI